MSSFTREHPHPHPPERDEEVLSGLSEKDGEEGGDMEWSKDEKLGEEGLCSWDQRGRTGSTTCCVALGNFLLLSVPQLPPL